MSAWTEIKSAYPNRFNTVADYYSFLETGKPAPIPPFEEVNGKNRLRDEWVNAPYEESFLVMRDLKRREKC